MMMRAPPVRGGEKEDKRHMKVFLSYFSMEEADAEDIAAHLKDVFKQDGIEVFMASSWESIAPGDEFEPKVVNELAAAGVLLVLMTHDALTRPWINFEIGVAWATKTRILFLCHKGMTPVALPRPYGGIQAVDLNGLTHEQKLNQVAEAVSKALDISLPAPRDTAATAEPTEAGPTEGVPFTSVHRSWTLRPAAHVGEKATARFLVGAVNPARAERAKAASLTPGEALWVRLFLGASAEGRYIHAMVGGEEALFFERVVRDTTQIDADLRVAAPFEDEGGNLIPLLVIDSFRQVEKRPG